MHHRLTECDSGGYAVTKTLSVQDKVTLIQMKNDKRVKSKVIKMNNEVFQLTLNMPDGKMKR